MSEHIATLLKSLTYSVTPLTNEAIIPCTLNKYKNILLLGLPRDVTLTPGQNPTTFFLEIKLNPGHIGIVRETPQAALRLLSVIGGLTLSENTPVDLKALIFNHTPEPISFKRGDVICYVLLFPALYYDLQILPPLTEKGFFSSTLNTFSGFYPNFPKQTSPPTIKPPLDPIFNLLMPEHEERVFALPTQPSTAPRTIFDRLGPKVEETSNSKVEKTTTQCNNESLQKPGILVIQVGKKSSEPKASVQVDEINSANNIITNYPNAEKIDISSFPQEQPIKKADSRNESPSSSKSILSSTQV